MGQKRRHRPLHPDQKILGEMARQHNSYLGRSTVKKTLLVGPPLVQTAKLLGFAHHSDGVTYFTIFGLKINPNSAQNYLRSPGRIIRFGG